MNQVTHKCLGTKFKYYLRVVGRTKPLTSALVRICSLPTCEWGGRTNQVTHKYFGQNSKSSDLQVERRTKSPTSALVKILTLPTYEWKDEPSYPQVLWSEF